MSVTFGAALRDHRVRRGISLRALASLTHYSRSHLCEIEQGRRPVGSALAASLDLVLDTGGRLAALAVGEDPGAFRVRSHKFAPAQVGPATVLRLVEELRAAPVHDQWTPCHRAAVAHPDGTCELWLWPHGVVVFHLVEERAWAGLAQLAAWRYDTYPRLLDWGRAQLLEAAGASSGPDYVLSAYWVSDTSWHGARLDTAMRILSMPSALLSLDSPGELSHAAVAERQLLGSGFAHPEMVPFGIDGVSVGYASWAGVAYHPVDAGRALAEDALVACELAVQSIWQYTSWIAAEVEAGRDPDVQPEHGWRWLRGVRSRLITARPQEPSSHRSMREAILATSGLPDMLDQAIATLREVPA